MEIENIFNKIAYLSFNLGNEIFAVSVQKVLEVLEVQKITRIPKTPDFVKGVINFRGEILPVVDTRMKFNLNATVMTSKSVIIVFDLSTNEKEMMLGALADSVKDVLEIRDEDILPVPELSSDYNAEFLRGMIKVENGFIMILNIEKIFSIDELRS